MRVVIDTNTVISGLFWSSYPKDILKLAQQKKINICTSLALLTELSEVLSRAKFDNRLALMGLTVNKIIDYYSGFTQIISVTQVDKIIIDDPDDDQVLACAIAGQAQYIISGDRHLLSLGQYQNIIIVNAADFLVIFNQQS